MRSRSWSVFFLCGFGVWTAIVTHLYYLPGAPITLFSGPVRPLPFWGSAMVELLRNVTGAVLVLLAAYGLGRLTPRRALPAERSPTEGLFVLALGFMGIALLSQAAAYAGVYRPRVVAAGVVVFAIMGAGAAIRERLWRMTLPVLRGADWPFAAVAAAAVLAALVGALTPEIEHDALWYHLWLPHRWFAAGRPVDIVEEYVSLYPLSWDLAYGATLSVAGPGAAKLLHFACLPLLGAITWFLTRDLAPRANASLATAIVVSTPTVIWEATTAYVDLALAWYLALSVFAIVRYDRTDDRRWLYMAAAMLGGGLAIKHLALVAAAVLGTVLMIRELRRRRAFGPAMRSAVLFTAIAMVPAVPWYARAYLQAGNPVFPDLYSVFGASPAERWNANTDRGLRGFKERFGRERTLGNLVALPWDITMHGSRYGGALGPLFLLLVPASLFARDVRHRWPLIAGCVAYGALWASPISSFQVRFLVPLIPVLSLLSAAGAQRVMTSARDATPLGPPVVASGLVALLTLNLPLFTELHDKDRHTGGYWLTHVLRGLPLGVVIGAESRDRYLAWHVPSFRAWKFINATLPGDAKVLTFSGGDHFYSERPRLWSDATAAHSLTWGAPVGTEARVRVALQEAGITHVLFDLRQKDMVTRELAIGSEQMRACCLSEVYADNVFALYEVRPSER